MFINAPTDNLTLTDPWPRVDRDLLDRFAKAPAANVGDVFDRLLVMDGGIRPFTSATRLVGTALPILTRAGDNLAIHRALDDAQPGDILVINGQGDLQPRPHRRPHRRDHGQQGRARRDHRRRIRDAETLAAQGLVVFARAATPAGPFKNGPGVIGAPVAVGGVVVSAGDIIVDRRRRRRARTPPPRRHGPPTRSTRSSPRKKPCAAASSPPADSPGTRRNCRSGPCPRCSGSIERRRCCGGCPPSGLADRECTELGCVDLDTPGSGEPGSQHGPHQTDDVQLALAGEPAGGPGVGAGSPRAPAARR